MKNNKTKGIVILVYVAIVGLMGPLVSDRLYAQGYDPEGRRDPFVPLVGVVEEGEMEGVGGVLSIEDVTVQGLLINPDGTRSAIINGVIIKEGETVEQLCVRSISDNAVVVEIDKVKHELKLYEER